MPALNTLTIAEAAAGLRAKKFSAVELTQACLGRITARNSELNAFITVATDSALAAAAHADTLFARGEALPLTGIPFAVKDAIVTEGVLSTGAAKILENYIPPFQSTVVGKILSQGAVMIGKNNCDSFGHGASNENSMYGPVRNPHDTSKVAGGSSGGSAAAVADHMCLAALGEDTGGSIRLPASFCGVVGMRPSYGRVSRFGIMPMASSLDTVGPFAKTTADLALIMETLAGHDDRDATSVTTPVPKYTRELDTPVRGLRVGVPKEYFEVEGMNAEVAALTQNAITQLKDLGCTIVPVSLPHTKYAIAVYYILVPSEDSSNLARLDGIRYGSRAQGDSLYEVYARSRAQGFPEEVKRRILIGTYALSAGYYDAYYKKAAKVRTLICQDFENVYKEVDVVIAPTAPFAAFGVGEKAADPLSLYLADVMLSPSSVAGIPALSVPAGTTKAGLPVGVQIMGPRMGESVVLRVGHQLEQQHV